MKGVVKLKFLLLKIRVLLSQTLNLKILRNFVPSVRRKVKLSQNFTFISNLRYLNNAAMNDNLSFLFLICIIILWFHMTS